MRGWSGTTIPSNEIMWKILRAEHNPWKRLAIAIIKRALKDVEADDSHTGEAREFLLGEDAEFLTSCLGWDCRIFRYVLKLFPPPKVEK